MSNRSGKESGHSKPAEKPVQSGDRQPPRPGQGLPGRVWINKPLWSQYFKMKKEVKDGAQSDKAVPTKPGKPDKHQLYPQGEKKNQKAEGTDSGKTTSLKPGSQEKHKLFPHDERKGQKTEGTQSENAKASQSVGSEKRNPFQSRVGGRRDKQGDTSNNDQASPKNGNLSGKERFERSIYATLDNVVGRKFDQDKAAPGETDRFLENLPENVRATLADPKTVMTIYTMASRPGSDSYNQALTERFGENLKREFIDKGVRAQIHVVATGETVARQAQADQATPGEKPPGDSDKSDRADEARFRVAVIDISPDYIDFEGDTLKGNKPLTVDERESHLEEDNEAGTRIFEDKIAPLGEVVRQAFDLGENPIFADSSGNPEEFIAQFEKQVSNTLKNPEIALVKALAGMFYEIFVRNPQRREISRERQPYLDAIGQGLAAGLDPQHDTYQPKDQLARELYQNARNISQKLAPQEQYQLRLHLALWYRGIYDISPRDTASGKRQAIEYLHQHMNGGVYSRAVEDIFSTGSHFTSD